MTHNTTLFTGILTTMLLFSHTLFADTTPVAKPSPDATSATLRFAAGLIPAEIGAIGFLRASDDDPHPEEGSFQPAVGAALGIERISTGSFRLGGTVEYSHNFGMTVEDEHHNSHLRTYSQSVRSILEVGQGLRIGRRVEIGYRFGTGPAFYYFTKKEYGDKRGLFLSVVLRATAALSIAITDSFRLFFEPSIQLMYITISCNNNYPNVGGVGYSAPIVIGLEWEN